VIKFRLQLKAENIKDTWNAGLARDLTHPYISICSIRGHQRTSTTDLRMQEWIMSRHTLIQTPIHRVLGTLSLGVKRPWREADHSPPSSSEVKEWVELYVHSPIRLHGTGTTLPLSHTFISHFCFLDYRYWSLRLSYRWLGLSQLHVTLLNHYQYDMYMFQRNT
jgi:hypothetical protein